MSNGDTDTEPETATLPTAGVIVTLVAPFAYHVSVELWPDAMKLGVAVMETTGVTPTITVFVALPAPFDAVSV